MAKKTQILLATYNGEEFLQQQLDSILVQTYTDWKILARDDGSTDDTLNILRAFQENHPDKIEIIADNGENLGSCQNFNRLMESSTSPVICFADQDDIWHPNKMEQSIQQLMQMEERYGKNTPLLVHHDISIVGRDGKQTSPSYDIHHKVGKKDSSLNHIFVQSVVTGFASTVNRALIQKTLPIPQKIGFHDLYLAFAAETFGHIGYISEQLADYRVHENNVIGGKSPFEQISPREILLPKNIINGCSIELSLTLLNIAKERLKDKYNNAAIFLNQHSNDIPEDKRALFKAFIRLAEAGPIERKAIILQNRFFPKSPAMATAFLALG